MATVRPSAAVRARCSRVTASPVEPFWTVGVDPRDSRAVQVFGPTTPSAVSPLPVWKFLAAVVVEGPKTPSGVPGS